jgi:hypothetical protein
MKIVDQVCAKIRPHLTHAHQSGQQSVNDFRELLKRIDTLTPHDKRYLGANFRLVVTKLSLFHYLPEIQDNEDIAFFQLFEVVIEKILASGTVKSRNEAINGLIDQFKSINREGTGKLVTVSEAVDLRMSFQSLRENISSAWDITPEKIPEFIERFRDNLSETSQSSRLLYDISKFGRDLRKTKMKYLEDVIQEIDEWEKRLQLTQQTKYR